MITTQTDTTFIESEQYSAFILENLFDGLLPPGMFRDVSDFGSGTTLHIKTIGDVQIQEVEEDVGITYTALDSGEVTLTITDYVGDGWYITDKMKQDGAQIDALKAARAKLATRAIQEYFETRCLASLNGAQTAGNTNSVNGFAHRAIGSGGTTPNWTMTLSDLIAMRLAFNKAQAPKQNRVAIVDPIVEATFNLTFNIQSGVGDLAANATWQSINENGFARDHTFVISLYGWNIITSNYLPTIASETIGANTITGGVANIFMCIGDDQVKPLMTAWRQMPRVEGERNKDMQRDEFVQTCRFGTGVQRVDTLGVILTSATTY